MKKVFPLLIILSSLMVGCNVNRSMTDITQSYRVKYLLQPVPNGSLPDYYVYNAQGFTRSSLAKFQPLKNRVDSIKQISAIGNGVSDRKSKILRSSLKQLQTDLDEIPKDSTVNYIVSFTDNIKGINYSIVRTYWWDYSNWRFLVPFLTYFNRYHNFNQCVNRAMDKCLEYNCDGVIIAGDYSTFKLFMVKQ